MSFQNITARVINVDYLNGLRYPYDYILKSGPGDGKITAAKTFDTLEVSGLQDIQTINDIDADEFIILNADQDLKHLITFEDLQIDESLQV